jgi:hypothetical protein
MADPGGRVREQGDRTRRTRDGLDRHGTYRGSTGTNAWQAIAIVALIAAAAGWTTVVLLAVREPASIAAVASPTPADTTDPGLVDGSSAPPVEPSHDDPALEAILPTTIGGVALDVQSVDGSAILTDDGWSTTISDFLTSVDKTATDLRLAEASDPTGGIDVSIDVYHVAGVDGASLSDALLAAWKGDNPDLVVTDVTIAGSAVKKIDFGQDGVPASYIYARDDYAFDIWTDDEALAAEALAAVAGSGQEPSATP